MSVLITITGIGISMEIKKLIMQFWKDPSDFPHDEFFEHFEKKLYVKLALHGCLGLDDYIQSVSEYYDLNPLKKFAYKSEHTHKNFSFNSILEAIFKPRYEHFRGIYLKKQNFKKLVALYYKVRTREKLPRVLCSLTYAIKHDYNILIEECIHAQHGSGFILDVDVEKLRNEFEGKTPLPIKDKAYGILTRNALEEKACKLKSFNALFIDFHDVHKLNEKYGYGAVNDMFRTLFSTFKWRKTDIVGRWFSGDEIVIITNGDVKGLQERFREHANRQGFSFYSVGFQNIAFRDLEKNIQGAKK